MTPRSSPLDRTGVALLLIAVAYLATTGLYGLLEPTETRYAEIAREMRASGDYLVPRLNEIPHFHKPPLAYWALAAGFALLGENEWGARVPVVLAALLALVFTIVAARRRFAALSAPSAAAGAADAADRASTLPVLALWVLAAMPLFLVIGRSVASDPFLAAAVAGFWAFAPSAMALALLGAGFLVKGPVVLVPTVLVVLIAALWGRERRSLKLLGPAWGWAAFVAVAVPWFLIVTARTQGLMSYLLTNQIWERYATQTHQRGGPPWYFIAVLIVGALPWTPALIAGLARLWRERSRAEARLLFCWLVIPLLFFSSSGSKLPAYLLPCLPAAALIAALALQRAGPVVRWSGALSLVILAALCWGFGPWFLGHAVAGMGAKPVALPLAAHAGLACWVLAAVLLFRSRAAGAALLVLLGLSSAVIAAARYEGLLGSPRPLARLLTELRAPGEPVVELKRFNAGLPFYLRQPVRLLDVPRETGFEERGRRLTVIVTRDSVASWTGQHRRVWILGPRGAAEELAAELGLEYQPVARWRKETLGAVSR